MKRVLASLILLVCLFAYAKEYRYKYTFTPVPKANLYIKGNKAVISSQGLTISVKQVNKVPFAEQFKVFDVKPNVFFIFFEIKITNNSGKTVYLDPNFISLVSNKKEYRKPMLYNDIYRALSKEYPQDVINKVFSEYLVEFANPIIPGKRFKGYLVFRNFREKTKNAMLKFDAVTIGVEQTNFLIIYNVKGEKINVENKFKKKSL